RVGLDHDPGGDLARGGCGVRGARAERNVEAEDQRAADGGGAGEEGAAIEANATHGRLAPLTRRAAAAWIAARMRWSVPQRQILVMAASISASVGCGFSSGSAGTRMLLPLWQ